MSTFYVDGQAQQLRATGVVEPVMEWLEDPTTGRRRPSDQQARDEAGTLLWAVETSRLVEEWGRSRTVVAKVTVPAATMPTLPAFEVVAFTGLVVAVRVPRGGGQLIESWTAAGLTAETTSGRRSAGEAA